MKISYYDLLGMTKRKQYPVIKYRGVEYKPNFDDVDGSFTNYQIKNVKEQNESARFYLSEDLLESEMFDKVLNIIKVKLPSHDYGKSWIYPKEDKKIEKIEQRDDTGLIGTDSVNMIEHTNRINRQAVYLSEIVSKINEIIEKVNGE